MALAVAAAAQLPLDAAELAYRFIDAAYRSSDSRERDQHGGIPGVTREYHAVVTIGKWGLLTMSMQGSKGMAGAH